MKRTLPWILAACLATGLLSGCGIGRNTTTPPPTKQAPQAVQTPRPQALTLNLGIEPPTLDSAVATDAVSFEVLNQVNEGLVRLDAGGEPTKGSGAAADWTISADGLVYTFTLKENLRWSDGQPLAARDFAYAWLRALDPKLATTYNFQLFPIQGAEEWSGLDTKHPTFATQYQELKKKVAITAPDSRTLRVTLRTPTPYFLKLTAFPTYFPQRQDLVEKHGDRYATDPDKLVYNGPFLIASWQHEAELVLGRNPTYWDAAAVKLETIHYPMANGTTDPLRMFEAGQVDQAIIPGPSYAQYQGRPGFIRRPTGVTWFLEFNLFNPSVKGYLANKHIRKAFDLAIDRSQFVTDVLRNGSEPATGLVPASIHIGGESYRKIAGDILATRANPEAARKELAQGLQELGLETLPPVDFLIGTGDTARKLAQGIQEMVQQSLPGVTINLVALAPQEKFERQRKADFDLVFAGWGADYDDPSTFLNVWVTGSPYNDARWSNEQFDALIKRAATLSGPQRTATFVQAETILLGELPIIPIYHPTVSIISKPDVKGVITPVVGAGLDLKGAYIEQTPN